jgi:ATP-dependent DNA helicase RecG
MADPLNIREQIEIAVSLAEGQFREFKSAYSGPAGKKEKREVRSICKDIGEALVAFANADGGELLIGVEDDGNITGTDDYGEADFGQIKDAPKTHVHKDTPLQSVLCREAVIESKRILYFRVSKGTRYIHLTSDGRCLKRNDLATVPVAAERIQFDRLEVKSREYDREFVDGATAAHLETELLRAIADQISPGISIDKCLQYLGLAEYDGDAGLRLRRAAVLLFAKSPDRWHPRVQARILRVNGTTLGTGADYNVSADTTVKSNILKLIDEAWDALRPHLAATRFHDDARFRTTYIYPEVACREALVNAIAHRDYAEEGRGIEIYVFDDRIEIRNPGGLLSSISVDDIKALRGVHQSRNSYIARTLREVGLMRELGEGMRRIFEVMKSGELAPPEISNDNSLFMLTLHHRPMYTKDETLWLDQYENLHLTAEEKATALLGRRGDLIAANDVIRRLGIVDIERFRQVIASLQDKGILETAVSKQNAQRTARGRKVAVREIPRWRVRSSKEIKIPHHETTPAKLDIAKIPSDSGAEIGQSQELYLGNIPPNTTEQDLISAFSAIGPLANIRIPQSGGLSRGYAFVEFDDKAHTQEALSSEIVLGGRKIVLRPANPRRPKKMR